MTLMFVCTGVPPQQNEHRTTDWSVDRLTHRIGSKPCREWRSLPARIARVIHNCALHSQTQRWDLSMAVLELERLHKAIGDSASVPWSDFWAEELLARSGLPSAYAWDQDQSAARVHLPSGVEVRVSGVPTERDVRLEMLWQSQGTEKHKNIRKFLTPASDRAVAHLRTAGWRMDSSDRKYNECLLSGRVDVDQARLHAEALAGAVAAAAREFKFE